MKTENISLSGSEKISLIISLGTMLSAGISLMDVINSLLDDAKGNQKKLLTTVKEDLTQGKRLYTSFAKFPNTFDKVTVNIIKASEEAGTLDSTLKQIRSNIQKDMEFSDKIKSALIYPMFIMLVFAAVLLMILIVVIPKISSVFLRMRVELPLPTKALMFTSNILLTYPIPVTIGVLFIFLMMALVLKTQKRIVFNILFSLPIIKPLIVKIDLARFTRSLAMLLSSGIVINSALEMTQEIVINNEVRRTIAHCLSMVLSGKRFSDGLHAHKNIVPSIMNKIIEAGERSGTLDKSLQEVSEYMDYDVSNALKTATALIEPIMLVAVGAMVGGMMLSIISPIYGLIGQVGGR